MTTSWTSRTSPTTIYTISPRTGDQHYLTWDESTDIWNNALLTWNTWQEGVPPTSYNTRITP